jgi:hypothetical protein
MKRAPTWLVDWAVESSATHEDAAAACRAWLEVLDGAEEVEPPTVEYVRLADTDKPTTVRLELGAAERIARYTELRARAAPPTPFDRQSRTGYWGAAVDTPAEDETHYVTPARASEITGLPPATLLAMRRRGRIRSIGMTASEYRRARQLAGWGDASGWGSGVWYAREDIERIARETRRAA